MTAPQSLPRSPRWSQEGSNDHDRRRRRHRRLQVHPAARHRYSRRVLPRAPARSGCRSPPTWSRSKCSPEAAARTCSGGRTASWPAFAAVSSPYLVDLYDAGQQGDEVYYSMEYLPGGSLAMPAEPPGRVRALTAVAHAARAVHALHEAGIAHQAIKPANVLLHPGGAKLADLGLSHVLTPGVTITKMGSAGDIGYVDPGLIRGDRPSRASDVYSLGATLHYALAREGLYGPLPEGDPLLAIRRIVSHPPVISARLEPDVRDVVAWAIAAEPAERPVTALQLAQRIENLALARAAG